MNAHTLLADRLRCMEPSAIRELLKSASQPGVISLAGGIPAPESFPYDLMDQLAHTALRKYGAQALQYGVTEGFAPLREEVAVLLAGRGITARPEEIQITSGSQGALDALAKVLITKGDKVAVESPTYLGALQAFRPYEPTFLRLDTDAEGPTPDSLRRLLNRHAVKFIYLVPTFQNPTGRTISAERRQAIAAVLLETGALLVEDDPYSALRYTGTDVPPIHILAPDNVVYIGTFSKILAPGLRVGFCVAPQPVRQWLVIAKQGVDLHTGSLSQAIAAEYLVGGYLSRHLPKIRALYAPRHRAMLEALETSFPPNFTWSKPEGGMFVWVTGPKGLDMENLYEEALNKNVAYVPGRFFHIDNHEGRETMRLNFTMCDETAIRRGIRILGDLFEPYAGRKNRATVGRHEFTRKQRSPSPAFGAA